MAVLKSISIDGTSLDNTGRKQMIEKVVSIPTGVDTLVPFDFNFDDDSGSRFVVSARATFPANATGTRQVRMILLNGETESLMTPNMKTSAAQSGITALSLATSQRFNSNQRIALRVMHNAGVALNVNMAMVMDYLG